jgi:pseudoazurin
MLLKIAIVAGALALAATAQAAEVQVKMLNKGASGAAMVFEPALVKIAPGDTVRFIPTDKSHDVASVDGMLPAGVQPFEGKVNEELAVTFTTPGVYGFKCKPHYGMGMVGVVVVGTPDNLAAAKAVKQTGMAKKAFDTLLSGL